MHTALPFMRTDCSTLYNSAARAAPPPCSKTLHSRSLRVVKLHEIKQYQGTLCSRISSQGMLRKMNAYRRCLLSRVSQAISPRLFADSAVESLELAGNILDKTDLMRMDGVDAFLSRREKNKNRNLQGGGMLTLSVCGLD